MKILIALFGYLAVTALPFLAFASPLAAMDYDGYVNSTQNHALMKKGLVNIVETSAQTHKDGALIKRVPGPGDVIEARQVEVIIPVAYTVLTMIADIGLSLWWISGDKPVRGMI